MAMLWLNSSRLQRNPMSLSKTLAYFGPFQTQTPSLHEVFQKLLQAHPLTPYIFQLQVGVKVCRLEHCKNFLLNKFLSQNSCMIHGILDAKQPVRSAETSGLLRCAWAYRKGKLHGTDHLLAKIMSSNMDSWSKLNHANCPKSPRTWYRVSEKREKRTGLKRKQTQSIGHCSHRTPMVTWKMMKNGLSTARTTPTISHGPPDLLRTI